MRRHRWHGRLPIVAALASLLVVVLASGARAANPIIDTIYTADPAALVVGDTMYIYAGHDEAAPGAGNFYMRDWHVLSSTDAAGWTDNGAKLSVADFAWAGADAWAGEVEPRNGKYYWYVPVNGNGPGWMDIGVAVGDTPLGPFRDAKGGPLISDGTPNSSPLNIDPTVFTDDDGQAYIYWGGYWGVRAAKLKSNMIELDGPVIAPTGLADYWEAPWMFKRNGVYYMVYAANDTNGCVTSSSYACQRYATASNPLGPWTQRGVILDRVSSTTSHAAVVEFKGQWYMVYHTADAPGGGDFRRSVAVDRLYFNADGTIQKVVQTRGGASGANRALTATASTSYVSPWESLAAVNDGFTPANSADRAHAVYGNWPQQGAQWVQYDWPGPVTLNRVRAYWFDDDLGIDLPASCSVRYWTGSAWQDPPGAGSCGVAGDTFNAVTFSPVTTTRIRLNITARSGYSTGLLELQALAP